MLNTDKNNNKILSIRISTDGFYFSTQSYNVHKQYASQNHLSQLKTELEVFLQQQSNFESIQVSVATQHFSLFPCEYASAEEDFDILFGELKNEKLLQNKLPVVGNTKILFSIDADVYDYFHSQFQNVAFVHSIQLMLDDVASHKQEGKVLYIDLYSNIFYAVIAEKENLIFANSFAFDADDMFVYLIANIFVQFSLSQQDTHVKLYDFDLSHHKRKILQKYIKNI